MGRLVLVACLSVTSGCDVIFGLERPDDAAVADGSGDGLQLPVAVPVQEKVASVVQPGPNPALSFVVDSTAPGNTLVLVIAIKTSAERIATVADGADNTWLKALDGGDSLDSSRLEIWYAPEAKPTTSVVVTMVTARSMAVSFTEWDAISAPVAAHTSAPMVSPMPATGSFATSAPALVIAATAFTGSQIAAPLATPEFTALGPFRSTDGANGDAAYAVVPAGDHEVTWSLPTQQTWTAGAVAFRLTE